MMCRHCWAQRRSCRHDRGTKAGLGLNQEQLKLKEGMQVPTSHLHPSFFQPFLISSSSLHNSSSNSSPPVAHRNPSLLVNQLLKQLYP